MNTKRIWSWIALIVVIILIVWGLIAASKKANQESASLAPVDSVTATDWTKGSTTTGITLIEYSDFQCPACGAYFPLVEEVFNKNPTSFLFVYRHFPLTQHANAIPAAKAAEAAGMQGKFWEMYEKLFSTQADWESSTDAPTIFASYAKALGLDMAKYAADVESPAISAKITASQKSGIKAGVNATPTFYLNGKKISPQTYDEFKKLIDEATSTHS